MASTLVATTPLAASPRRANASAPRKMMRSRLAGARGDNNPVVVRVSRVSITGPRRTRAIAVARATATAPPETESSATNETSAYQFDWAKAWYPMSPIAFLDPTIPNPMKVLGKSLVAWKSEDGTWSVANDECPHRMAPLSMGFLSETNQLVCRYHGWEFNGKGEATRVPMSGAFYTLVPIRPHWRGERRSSRTLPGASLRSPLAFNPRPRHLSTPTDAFQLNPDIRSYGTTLSRRRSFAARAPLESLRWRLRG